MLRPTKRKLLVFAILFFTLFFYVPVIKCLENTDAKDRVCELYGACETDYYYPLSGIIGLRKNLDGLCPAASLNGFMLISMTGGAIGVSYLLACLLDKYYEKYRNV